MLTPAYLDQEHVKDAIGAVKVNFTSTSSLEIFNKFNTVGDWVFGNSKAYIEELLDAGQEDYEAVFKSRPRVQTSPLPSPSKAWNEE